MLLTGFDAPAEQVMYLDRHIKEAELLQAIARVNRTAHGKNAGYVVDYYGVAENLKVALAAYAAEDVEGAMTSIADQVPLLAERRQAGPDPVRGSAASTGSTPRPTRTPAWRRWLMSGCGRRSRPRSSCSP